MKDSVFAEKVNYFPVCCQAKLAPIEWVGASH